MKTEKTLHSHRFMALAHTRDPQPILTLHRTHPRNVPYHPVGRVLVPVQPPRADVLQPFESAEGTSR